MSRSVSILVLLGILTSTRGWGQSRTSVPFPALQSDPPNTVVPEDAAVSLVAGHVSVDLSVSTAEESPAVLLESPFFGGNLAQDAYPDPQFPELEIRDDGAPSELEDRFQAFMGNRNITHFLKSAGMDPWSVTRTPPTTSAHPLHPEVLKALSNIDAIEKSGDDYVGKWQVRRVVRIPLKAAPHQHVELNYTARPAVSVMMLTQVDTTAREKIYCVSPQVLRRLSHTVTGPSRLVATEYTVATGIDGKPPNAVTVTMSAPVDPTTHASTYFFLCGPHGKPIAKKNTVTREHAELSEGDTLHVLALTEVTASVAAP
jgi:hypothetical protein